MKKTWLFFIAGSLCVLALAWCNSKCDCNCPNCEIGDQEVLGEAGQFCLDHWWTYSVIHYSETEIDWECSFPTWIACDDDLMLNWACNYEPDVTNIDTEEERLASCNENVDGWIKDIENWEIVSTDWEDESEGGASFVRNGVVHYKKDWSNWKMSVECIADFVDWSISASFGDNEVDE